MKCEHCRLWEFNGGKQPYGLFYIFRPLSVCHRLPVRFVYDGLVAADCSFVLLEVTCSPRGLGSHMQMFGT